MVCPHVAPSRTGASELQRAAPCQADPAEAVGGAIDTRPPTLRWFGPPRLRLLAEASVAGEVDGLTSMPRVLQAVDSGAAPRCLQSLLIRGGGPQTFMFQRPRSNSDRCRGRRIGPRAVGGGAFLPLRRRIGVEQPPSWWAPSVQPPSRAHRAARRRSPRCYPKCNLLSSELPS
jgi:hypothetical protein